LSISRFGFISAFLAAFPFTLSAQTTPSAENFWIVVSPDENTQNDEHIALTEQDSRRLSHYSEQTLAAIYAHGDNPVIQGANIDTLHQKISRLVDAGNRSGYETTQTADFFEGYIAEKGLKPIPATFKNNDGDFDALSFFEAIEAHFQQSPMQVEDPQAVIAQDLAAIRSVATGTVLPIAEPEAVQVEIDIIAAEGPVIPEGADVETRDILARVEITEGDWVIKVKQGDSLAGYAHALLGDRRRFSEIFALNRGVLRSANLLSIGQVIVLPQ